MDAIPLPAELQRLIETQVAAGRAASPSAFLEEAVRRLVDDSEAEETELLETIQAGIADIEAGRFTTVSTVEEHHALQQRLMAGLENGTETP